jgi:hypothetical protein
MSLRCLLPAWYIEKADEGLFLRLVNPGCDSNLSSTDGDTSFISFFVIRSLFNAHSFYSTDEVKTKALSKGFGKEPIVPKDKYSSSYFKLVHISVLIPIRDCAHSNCAVHKHQNVESSQE